MAPNNTTNNITIPLPPPPSSINIATFDVTSYSPMRASVITLCTCAFLGSLLTAFWIVAGRNRFEVRITQPGTTFACFFSLALMNGGIILGVRSDTTPEWCVARLWTLQLSIAMVLICNFMKTGRMYAMDRNANASPLRISEERFFLFLVVYLFLHACCLGYWTFFEPLNISTEWGEPVCVSQGWIGQVIALCSLIIVWFVWFYWATATHHLGPKLTEYAWACAVCVGLCGLTVIAAGYLGTGSVIVSGPVLFNQDSKLLAEAIAGFVVSCSMSFFVIYPKLNNRDGFEDMVSDIERRRAEKRRGSALTAKSSRSSLTATTGGGEEYGGISRHGSMTSMDGGIRTELPSHTPSARRGSGGSSQGGVIVPHILVDEQVWEAVV